MKHHFRSWITTAVAGWLVFNAPWTNVFALPALSPPTRPDSSHLRFSVMNSSSNVSYTVQVSTNLTTWTPVLYTNSSSASNFSVTVWATNYFQFFRVITNMPISAFSLLAKSNIDLKGNTCRFDSFDSTNPTYSTDGLYDVTKFKADCNVASLTTVTNSLNIGNATVYGSVYTRATNTPFLGLHGIVGDAAYDSGPDQGTIEAGHWTSNLDLLIPDVSMPITTGWATSLPTPGNNGYINLSAGASYVITSMPTAPLLVSGPNRIWVNAHGTFQFIPTVAFTNNGCLVMYFGESAGTGDTLSWANNNNVNSNGYAANLQIYCLPSVTSINFRNTAVWNGILYAPEANFVCGGGGANIQDTSGAIVVNSVAISGRWNFHYDESLARTVLLP